MKMGLFLYLNFSGNPYFVDSNHKKLKDES